ncbi:unnamed protein product [Caenorhabditis brenneri]
MKIINLIAFSVLIWAYYVMGRDITTLRALKVNNSTMAVRNESNGANPYFIAAAILAVLALIVVWLCFNRSAEPRDYRSKIYPEIDERPQTIWFGHPNLYPHAQNV